MHTFNQHTFRRNKAACTHQPVNQSIKAHSLHSLNGKGTRLVPPPHTTSHGRTLGVWCGHQPRCVQTRTISAYRCRAGDQGRRALYPRVDVPHVTDDMKMSIRQVVDRTFQNSEGRNLFQLSYHIGTGRTSSCGRSDALRSRSVRVRTQETALRTPRHRRRYEAFVHPSSRRLRHRRRR